MQPSIFACGVVYGPPRGSHCGMAQMEEAVARYPHQH
jgi:hypothetical protein